MESITIKPLNTKQPIGQLFRCGFPPTNRDPSNAAVTFRDQHDNRQLNYQHPLSSNSRFKLASQTLPPSHSSQPHSLPPPPPPPLPVGASSHRNLNDNSRRRALRALCSATGNNHCVDSEDDDDHLVLESPQPSSLMRSGRNFDLDEEDDTRLSYNQTYTRKRDLRAYRSCNSNICLGGNNRRELHSLSPEPLDLETSRNLNDMSHNQVISERNSGQRDSRSSRFNAQHNHHHVAQPQSKHRRTRSNRSPDHHNSNIQPKNRCAHQLVAELRASYDAHRINTRNSECIDRCRSGAHGASISPIPALDHEPNQQKPFQSLPYRSSEQQTCVKCPVSPTSASRPNTSRSPSRLSRHGRNLLHQNSSDQQLLSSSPPSNLVANIAHQPTSQLTTTTTPVDSHGGGSSRESSGQFAGSDANLLAARAALASNNNVNSVALLANNLNANLAHALAQFGLNSAKQEAAAVSALRASINEKQRLQKEQVRNELNTRLKSKSGASGAASLSACAGFAIRRKPKHHFLSQLYFLLHLSCTLCLVKVPDLDRQNGQFYAELLSYYFAYLLGTAILFILALRCCKNQNLFEQREKRSENTSILFGCIILGIIQLISIGLDMTQCLENEFLFLPILQFSFVFLLMHFILVQTKLSNKYFYNNIAVAHLLVTQVSVWLGHFQSNRHSCGPYLRPSLRTDLSGGQMMSGTASSTFGSATLATNNNHSVWIPFMRRMLETSISTVTNLTSTEFHRMNSTDIKSESISSTYSNNKSHPISAASTIGNSTIDVASSSPSQLSTASVAAQLASNVSNHFSDLLLPVMQHYQLLAIFILVTIWVDNNRVRPNYLRPRLGESGDANVTCLADAEFANAGFLANAGRLHALKGFFLGMLIISITIIVLVLGDDYITLLTHSSIQGICALVSLVGLLLRGRKRKGLHKLPVKYFDPNEFHLFVVSSLVCAYFCAFCAILLNLMQSEPVPENLLDSCLLMFQITLQTLLLRTDGRKIHKLREFYGFLIVSNFSLWVLEVTEIASLNSMRSHAFSLNILPQIMVSLNRFYSALVFIHFWQSK